MKRDERIAEFVEAIWAWYARHKRVLPWRDLPDIDVDLRAYKVLVSEVMLQQTQVPRVIVKYKEFVQRFPSVQALAAASNRDVILAWRGMGYNSRALRLRDAAKTIAQRADGFPISMEFLLSVPGIGPYTASAIRNFAFNIPTPCIDTNIRRILHRMFYGPENADGSWRIGDETLLKLSAQVLAVAIDRFSIFKKTLPEGAGLAGSPPSEWHAALMDFGSLVQTKRSPKWDICPLTAGGIMKTTKKSLESRVLSLEKKRNSESSTPKTEDSRLREPGRLIAGRFTPNRIVRGRIVELLRDAERPLTLERIGREVCMDWSARKHKSWLDAILGKLVRDAMVQKSRRGYGLQI